MYLNSQHRYGNTFLPSYSLSCGVRRHFLKENISAVLATSPLIAFSHSDEILFELMS